MERVLKADSCNWYSLMACGWVKSVGRHVCCLAQMQAIGLGAIPKSPATVIGGHDRVDSYRSSLFS
jgi:hypothetical protein